MVESHWKGKDFVTHTTVKNVTTNYCCIDHYACSLNFQVAPVIKEKMVKEGTLMIGFQPLEHKSFVNFFRVVIESPAVNHDDMDFVIEEIERFGQDIG